MDTKDIKFEYGYAKVPLELTIRSNELSIQLLHLLAKSLDMEWVFDEKSLEFTVDYLPNDEDHEDGKMVYTKDGEIYDERGDLFECIMRLAYAIVPNGEGRERFE